MTRYHWLVFVLCTLGWSFGCFGQQLFVLQRTSTADLLLGWAVGGLFFGILGDKYGRSRMMVWTIVIYSVFTGLSGLAVTYWDLLLFRFLAGLGVGGQFVVGVVLVAETMPDRIRSYALGFLQIFATQGVLAATFLSMGTDGAWRIVLMIGAFPIVLVYFVVQYLDEPEIWKLVVRDQDDGRKNAGSLRELFGPVYRRQAILGTILTSTGVAGLAGTVFFSVDLCQSVGRRLAVEHLKAEGTTDLDLAMIGYLVKYPQLVNETFDVDPGTLLGNEKNNGDVRYLFEAVRELREQKKPMTDRSVAEEAVNRWNRTEGKGRQTAAIPLGEVERRKEIFLKRLILGTALFEEPASDSLSGAELWTARKKQLVDYLERIEQRTKQIRTEAGHWRTMSLLLINIGALFGMIAVTMATSRLGRRAAFTVFLAASILSVLGVFLFANDRWGIYTLVPAMGFFLSALFGGYAIYLPELFPTRIRSTAISCCYGSGLFVATLFTVSAKPLATMQSGFGEPSRWIDATMIGVFLLGIVVPWMLPETKDKPLPT